MIPLNQIENQRIHPSLDKKIAIPSLSHIKSIKDAVKPIVNHYHSKPAMSKSFPDCGLALERSIITDAVTLLELKLNESGKSLLHKNALRNFIQHLDKFLVKDRINFDNTVKIGAQLLKINNLPYYSEAIHTHPEFADNKILRTELDLFVNRGNFNWTTADRSNFPKFLLNPFQKKLDCNDSINCWEAMLYSLIRAEAINKRDVAQIYSPQLKQYEIFEGICKAFRWETSKNITDKELLKKAASYNPYFIAVSFKGSKYLAGICHDMISFPNSTDKLLQVISSGKFEGGPDNKMTVYSHWDRWTDSRLGIAPNNAILNIIDDKELHIIPLHTFIKKFPTVSQKVVQNINNSPYIS